MGSANAQQSSGKKMKQEPEQDTTDTFNEKRQKQKSQMHVPRWHLLLTGIVIALGGSFHFGFNISLVNPTEQIFEDFLNVSMYTHFHWRINKLESRFLWSTIAGLQPLGAAIGALLAPMLLNRFGRKTGLIVSASVLAISSPISGLSKFVGSVEMFALGRSICGIGCGLINVCQGVYLTEISPIKYRGMMGTLTECAVEVGFVMGSFLGLPQLLGTKDRWPIIYVVDLLPSLLLLTFLFTAKESPAFLLSKRNSKLATESIRFYYDKDDDVAMALEETEKELMMEKDRLNIWQVWRDRPIRNATILAMVLNIGVSFSGIMVYSFFGVFFLKAIGFDDNSAGYVNAAAASMCIVSAVTNTFIIERTGRRKLIMFSLLGLATLDLLVMLLVIIFNQTHAPFLGYIFIVFLCSFLFMDSLGAGAISWFLGSELTPPRARSSVQSLALSTQHFSCFLSPVIYYPLESFIGPYSFLVFIVILLLTTIYIYFKLPETKNREVNDIMADLGGKQANDVAAFS